jgi:predicted secreted Zn-dependent protease
MLQAAGGAQAQIYRCEQNGKLAFSDQPCKAGAKATQKDYAPSASPSGTLDMQVAVRHYPVQGRDYASLSQSLKANGPKGFHGLATWNIRYDYTTRKQRDGCQVDTVQVKVSGEILMPNWADETAAPADLRQRWSAYYAALKQHEDGHIQHGRELALLVKEKLMGLGVVPCESVQGRTESEFQRLTGNLKARDQEYDARTQHGASQGAQF